MPPSPPALSPSLRCISPGQSPTVPRAVPPTGSQTTTATRPATTPCVTGTEGTVREPLATAGREEPRTLSSPGVRVGGKGDTEPAVEPAPASHCTCDHRTPIVCSSHHHTITSSHLHTVTLVSCHISPSHLLLRFLFAEHRTADNCNSGCLNNWLGDRYCDQVLTRQLGLLL